MSAEVQRYVDCLQMGISGAHDRLGPSISTAQPAAIFGAATRRILPGGVCLFSHAGYLPEAVLALPLAVACVICLCLLGSVLLPGPTPCLPIPAI